MKFRGIIFGACAILFWYGCDRVEETVSTKADLKLVFSADTIAFDTLISERKSYTKRLSVRNPNREAILFTRISLKGGTASDYSLIINGRETTTIQGVVLFGGDSILLLIDVNIAPQNRDLPYLVADEVFFEWNGTQQGVKLVSYGQDGIEVSNRKICDEVWTKDRPYLLSDSSIVEQGCNLTIEKGARVYFENDAVLMIQGSLSAVGDSADRITITNSRFDNGFDDVPGQWNGIYFLEGSMKNEVSYADISNGETGLWIETPDDDNIADLVVNSTRIFNMSKAGILAFTSDLKVTNTLIYNCGAYLVGNFTSGNYTYVHCTFSNEQSSFISNEPHVQFSDNVTGGNQHLKSNLSLLLANNIIWGSRDEELLIRIEGGTSSSVELTQNIIRSATSLENNFTSNEFNFPGLAHDYSLDTLSFAKDRAKNRGIATDLFGNVRDNNPDIGAIERIEN